MSRRVLITGAGGFVGSHLAAGFAGMGDDVTALDRAFDARTRDRLKGLRLVEAELDRTSLAGLGAFDVVIHGAAVTTPSEALGISDTAHIKINLDLLLDCLDFARESGAGHFVFVSSSGVFDDRDAMDRLLESTTASGNSPYAVAKRAGEVIVEAACHSTFRAFSIRLGPVYGPFEASRDSRRVVSQVRRWLDATLSGQPIVVRSPQTERDWTYAPDLAPALDLFLRGDATRAQVIHLGAAEIVNELDLAHLIARLVPGGSVMVEPDDRPRRLPMASVHRDMLDRANWTGLETGLAQIIACEARP